MKPANIQRLGSLMCVLLLTLLIRQTTEPLFPFAGGVYLLLANFLACSSVLTASKERKIVGAKSSIAQRGGPLVLLLSSLQVSFIGCLHLLGEPSVLTEPKAVLGYLLTALSAVISFAFVAGADSASLEGGYVPVRIMGKLRSRRLIFLALMYSPVGPIVVLSILWLGWEKCPLFLRPPAVWLLLSAIVEFAACILVMHRFRNESTKPSTAGLVWILATLTVLLALIAILTHADGLASISSWAAAVSVGLTANCFGVDGTTGTTELKPT